MKIKIKKCSDQRYWYNDFIGKTFDVHLVDDHYWVKASDGFANLVKFQDAETVPSDKTVKVSKCTNVSFWYANDIGNSFDVVEETDTAYWVKLKQANNRPIDWIYKSDCEVL